MHRNEWKFDYTATSLAQAAQAKIAHHEARLAYWKGKREQTLATIRSEGLEIDEKIVLGTESPKSRDWDRGNRVTVRDDLRQQLNEVLDKLRFHTDKLMQYTGWQQLLRASPDARLGVDIDDWLFFFGNA